MHRSMLPLVERLTGTSNFGGLMSVVAACSMTFPLRSSFVLLLAQQIS